MSKAAGRLILANPEILLELSTNNNGLCDINNQALRQLVGFKGLGAEPYLDTIKVVVLRQELLRKMARGLRPDDEDYEEMDLFTLFIRRPPYEPETFPPVTLNERTRILGSYAWFVKPNNGSLSNWNSNSILIFKNNKLMQSLVSSISSISIEGIGLSTNIDENNIISFFINTGIIGYGDVKSWSVKRKPRIELKVIVIPSLLEHVISSTGLPEVRAELNITKQAGQETINIVYGLDSEVLRLLRSRLIWQRLRQRYLKYLKEFAKGKYWKSKDWLNELIDILEQYANRKGIRYDVSNFNYVSYCAASHYMSAFPLAPRAPCPFCHKIRGKSSFCISKLNGKLFHWRRQAFPKVYPRFTSDASIHKALSKGVPLPFAALEVDNIGIYLVVDGIDMFVPDIGRVGIDFAVEFQELLYSTNGVFVLIPDSVIGLLVNALSTTAGQGCSIRDSSGKADLLRLLLTKFVIRNIGLYDLAAALKIDPSNGVNLSVSLLSQYIDRVFNIQASDLNGVYNAIVSPGNQQAREVRRQFSRFIEEVLAHTVAHVLYILVRENPDIPEENIAYIHGVARPESVPGRVVYAGVYERSKYGTLQLSREIADTLKKQASQHCPHIKTLTEAVQCLLLEYFEDAERKYASMQSKNSLRSTASSVLSSYPQAIAGYKSWLSAGLAGDIVAALQDLINAVYQEFKRLGFELDFPSFNFIITQKKEDIKSYLVNYVKGKLGNKAPDDEEIEDVVEAILRETLQNAILAVGPDYCLDGCYLNVHLEKECTKAVEENLHVSWELLRLFLYLTGLLRSKPGLQLRPMIICEACRPAIVRVTGSAILNMLRQASRRVKIGSAYVNADAINFIKELLDRGVSVTVTVDSRSCKPGQPDDPCKMLEQLKQQYGDRFKYSIAGIDTASTHEKEYVIDNLRVCTSWNFLVGSPGTQQRGVKKGPVVQNYVAEYVARGEE